MKLKKQRGCGRCLVAVDITLKKNFPKRKAWQMFSFIFNSILPPGRVYIYALMPTFSLLSGTRIIVSVLVQYLYSSTSTLKLVLWHLDTLLKESVDWKINT